MWGSTNKDFPESSHALHKAAALSDAVTSSPVDKSHKDEERKKMIHVFF